MLTLSQQGVSAAAQLRGVWVQPLVPVLTLGSQMGKDSHVAEKFNISQFVHTASSTSPSAPHGRKEEMEKIKNVKKFFLFQDVA